MHVTTRTHHHSARGRASLLLPCALALVLVGMFLVVHHRRSTVGGSGSEPPRPPVSRRIGDARVRIPSDWQPLAAIDGTETWGSRDHAHTVTVGTTESSILPVAGVVATVVREATTQSGDTHADGAPEALELHDAPAGDSAMLVRFRVDDAPGDEALRVTQVWRRDARAGLDVVATWTSRDGTWPVRPAAEVPQLVASG